MKILKNKIILNEDFKDEIQKVDDEIGKGNWDEAYKLLVNTSIDDSKDKNEMKNQKELKDKKLKNFFNDFINKFFKSYDRVSNIVEPLRLICQELGFNELDNPFLTFIKNWNRKSSTNITPEILNIVKMLYEEDIIDDKDLKGTTQDKLNNIIYNLYLYTYNEEEIKFIVQAYNWLSEINNIKNYINQENIFQEYNARASKGKIKGEKQDLTEPPSDFISGNKLRNFIMFSEANPGAKPRSKMKIQKLLQDSDDNPSEDKVRSPLEKDSKYKSKWVKEEYLKKLSKEEALDLIKYLNDTYGLDL